MSNTETGGVTGTSDLDYDILWFTEACLSNALRLEGYIQDAERAGDQELADFFRRAQHESRKGAEQNKQMLAGASRSEGVDPGGRSAEGEEELLHVLGRHPRRARSGSAGSGTSRPPGAAGPVQRPGRRWVTPPAVGALPAAAAPAADPRRRRRARRR